MVSSVGSAETSDTTDCGDVPQFTSEPSSPIEAANTHSAFLLTHSLHGNFRLQALLSWWHGRHDCLFFPRRCCGSLGISFPDFSRSLHIAQCRIRASLAHRRKSGERQVITEKAYLRAKDCGQKVQANGRLVVSEALNVRETESRTNVLDARLLTA